MTRQEIKYSLDSPAGCSLSWMDSTADENDRFLDVLFWGMKMFFREEDSVAVLSYLFLYICDFGLGWYWDCIDEVEIVWVT